MSERSGLELPAFCAICNSLQSPLDGRSISHVMLGFLHSNLTLSNGLVSSFESPGVASIHTQL
jgi:hypothetical protein